MNLLFVIVSFTKMDKLECLHIRKHRYIHFCSELVSSGDLSTGCMDILQY